MQLTRHLIQFSHVSVLSGFDTLFSHLALRSQQFDGGLSFLETCWLWLVSVARLPLIWVHFLPIRRLRGCFCPRRAWS